MKSRAVLDEEIAYLAAWMPTMLAQTDEASQMNAFAERAQLIAEQASPDDAAYVRARLQRILVENCLIPSDEGPCG